MNGPYSALLIPGIISDMAEMSREQREFTDDPRRSAGAKQFKRKKKKSRMAADSRRRNRKNGR